MSNPRLDDRVDKRFGTHGGEGGSYMNDNDWLVLAAHRGEDRPGQDQFVLSAWPAANCLRELRGDNHWVLCAAKRVAWGCCGNLCTMRVSTQLNCKRL